MHRAVCHSETAPASQSSRLVTVPATTAHRASAERRRRTAHRLFPQSVRWSTPLQSAGAATTFLEAGILGRRDPFESHAADVAHSQRRDRYRYAAVLPIGP